MYSDLDIVYAHMTDSANYSKQCYQKLVERSIDGEREDFNKKELKLLETKDERD